MADDLHEGPSAEDLHRRTPPRCLLLQVVVLGGGLFGTAMAAHVAAKKAELEVSMVLRDDLVCRSINHSHINCKYLPEHRLLENIVATSAADALAGADFCFHAVPVQFSSSFLESISTHVDPKLPFISFSKGPKLNILRTMSKIIPQALGYRRQPFIVLSGHSFAVELMNKLPTAMVVASKDKKFATSIQQLLASPNLVGKWISCFEPQRCSSAPKEVGKGREFAKPMPAGCVAEVQLPT